MSSEPANHEVPKQSGSEGATLIPPRAPIELRITIQRTADAEKDKKLLSWVYDLLRGRPGTDRFCIVVRKNGSAMQLDFPNDTTEFTPALEQQLTRRLGAGSVEVRRRACRSIVHPDLQRVERIRRRHCVITYSGDWEASRFQSRPLTLRSECSFTSPIELRLIGVSCALSLAEGQLSAKLEGVPGLPPTAPAAFLQGLSLGPSPCAWP